MKNGYPSNFIGICIKTFLDRLFIDKKIKKRSNLFTTIYRQKVLHNYLLFCHFKVIFYSACELKTNFVLKIPLMKKLLCNVVYCYTCSNYNFTCYGKTCRYFFSSAAKHLCFSNLTDKYTRNVKGFAIFSDHLLQCYC